MADTTKVSVALLVGINRRKELLELYEPANSEVMLRDLVGLLGKAGYGVYNHLISQGQSWVMPPLNNPEDRPEEWGEAILEVIPKLRSELKVKLRAYKILKVLKVDAEELVDATFKLIVDIIYDCAVGANAAAKVPKVPMERVEGGWRDPKYGVFVTDAYYVERYPVEAYLESCLFTIALESNQNLAMPLVPTVPPNFKMRIAFTGLVNGRLPEYYGMGFFGGFYSLFPRDVECGGLGPFTGIPDPKDAEDRQVWLVNPFWSEYQLEKTARQCVEALERWPSGHLQVIFVGPAWNDAEYLKVLEGYSGLALTSHTTDGSYKFTSHSPTTAEVVELNVGDSVQMRLISGV